MGGCAGGFTEEEQPSDLLPGAAQRFDPDGRRPPVSSQEARLKLLADAFPGLAGALSLASAFLGLAARNGAPTRLAAERSGLGSLGCPVLSSNPLIRNYADHPTVPTPERPPQTQRSNLQPVQATKPPVPQNTPTRLDTEENIDELARIITSEASVGNDIERASVGFTVLNRMLRNGTTRVSDVSSAFSDNQPPRADAVSLATKILRGELPDPTTDATHFYSPRYMPKVGEPTTGYDTSGGQEQTGKLKKKNYKPEYTKTYIRVKIPGVNDERFKFWREPGNGPVQ